MEPKMQSLIGKSKSLSNEDIAKGVALKFKESIKSCIEKRDSNDTNSDLAMTEKEKQLFYKERNLQTVALANILHLLNTALVTKTWRDDKGVKDEGWFILTFFIHDVKQFSYHLPAEYWDDLNVPEIEYNNTYDGHTKEEAIERLEKFTKFTRIATLNLNSYK